MRSPIESSSNENLLTLGIRQDNAKLLTLPEMKILV